MRPYDDNAPERQIVGFHQDDESHWVAELACGHAQHVRHEPPMQNRPWVLDADERSARLGSVLRCMRCLSGEPVQGSESN